MPEQNPTDLQPGDKIEVLECYCDSSRIPEWEGLGVVECADPCGVEYLAENGEHASLLTDTRDKWRRAPESAR